MTEYKGDLVTVSITAIIVAAASYAGTRAVLRYAIRRAIYDVPNHRSSHSVPTPRGGGAAIVCASLLAVIALARIDFVAFPLAIALLGGASAVAVSGWVDDRKSVPAKYRAALQFLAAAWVMYFVRGFPVVRVGTAVVELGVGGAILGALLIVWCANLFNFMDGIDGLAGGHAAAVGISAGIILSTTGYPGIGVVAATLGAASLGFLALNWQPAKIFMGDVGSATLGFSFATLAIASENAGAMSLLCWLILLSPFVVDATLTLLDRIRRGRPWYEPHREHAYQRLVIGGLAHWQVSGAFIVTTLMCAAVVSCVRGSAGSEAVAFVLSYLVLAGVYLLISHRFPVPRAASDSVG